MKVIHGLEAVEPPLMRSVLAVGNFDGVHRAHRGLLERAQALSAETGGPVVALTFEPHPLAIVAPSKCPPRLALLEDKLRRLSEAGVQIAVVARSEPALLTLEAERFIEDVLIRRSSWHYYASDRQAAVNQVAHWMAGQLGWSAERKDEELARYKANFNP